MIDELKACRGSFITSIFPISGTNVRSHRFYDMTICIYMHYDELSLAELRRFFFWGAISKVLVPTEVERSFISTRTLDPMQCDPKGATSYMQYAQEAKTTKRIQPFILGF